MKKTIYVIVLFFLGILTACDHEQLENNKTVTPKTTNPNTANYQSEASNEKNQVEDSPQTANCPLSFLPEGWGTLEDTEGYAAHAEGDLNKDGINDMAAVIERLQEGQEEGEEEGEEAPPRALLIAFGNGDGTYTLSIIAENVILNRDEGGVWGDPFESLSIERGSVLVSHYGGSNWRWYNKYRFRFQENDWYLIGATWGSYYTGNAAKDNAEEEDYNLLTGDFIIKQSDENGKETRTKGNRGRRKLVKLSEFHLEDM